MKKLFLHKSQKVMKFCADLFSPLAQISIRPEPQRTNYQNDIFSDGGVVRLGMGWQTCRPVWPDWVIYWTLDKFLKPLATINLPKSPKF